jgi:hypothetical protein
MKQLLFLAAALALSTGLAHATQTDNRGIHAVPAPGKVSVDGSLSDWDTSGQVLMCYDLEALRDIYSAQVAAMYDAQNFYVGIHWKDPHPMGNSHDPRYQANKGWAGDAVQLRFKTDRISHLTAWYYAAKKEPAIQISYGKDLTHPFGGGEVQLFQTEGAKLQQGAEMAFKEDADGKGYVQEIKLPWKLITGTKTPAAGERFSMGVELLWGESDWPDHRYADNLAEGASSREFFWTAYNNWGPVVLEPKGKLNLPEPAYMIAYRQAMQGDAVQGPVTISYTLPRDARVSLAIEDESGHRVRNLVPALPRKKGKNTEKWDGLDDDGKPVPPGKYRFKAIYHDTIHANYALSFANPGNPTWSTPDGRGAFYGDHTAPQAAAAAGQYVALACPMGEAGQHLIGLDLSGQRLWGLPNRAAFDGGHITLATDGKVLWVGNEGKQAIVYRVDIATGRYAPWNKIGKDAEGNDFKVLDLPVSDLPGIGSDKTLGVNLSSIAEKDGVLVVALKRENLVKLLDAQTGEEKSRVPIGAPQSVAFSGDGSLLVLSEGRVLRLDKDGKTNPFSTLAFPDAYALVEDNGGQVLVSVRGDDQNVKVLSPQGVLVREIGARGGRPHYGPFNANAMRAPAQIAVDSRNRLWVTEETVNPKRTSVWDIATGKLLKDLSGTTTYAGAGAINPFDPTMAFSDDTVYRLDWDKGTYEAVYSLGKRDAPNDLFPPSVHDITSRVVKRGERTYVYTGGAAATSPEVHATLWDGKEWRSAAHIGVVRVDGKKGRTGIYQHPFFAGHENEAYTWSDQNGDGLVQEAELKFATIQLDGKPVQLRSYYWGQLPDAQGTVTYIAHDRNALVRFPVTGTTPAGAPIYDLTTPQIIRVKEPILEKGNGEGQIIGGEDGRVYINQSPIITVEADGRVSGAYPSNVTSVHGSHKATAARPGYIIGPSSFLGTADIPGVGEVFYLNGNLGENYLFTSDALYIQTLFKDTRGYADTPNRAVRGMPMDAMTAGGESFGGNFIRASNGKIYLTLGGTDARVMEITGLDSIRRLSGTFTYTPRQYAEAQKLATEKAARANAPKEYSVARATTPAVIDGKANEWPELLDDAKPLLEIQDSPRERFARVQARYDERNLYLGYRVFAPRSSMKNSGQDERLLFKTGDAVDLMIGPQKSNKGEGDLRLLMTVKDGQPIAVLNQKVAPNAAPNEKFDFSSPWRTITFDRVVTLKDVSMASGPINGGIFVEAAIPWSTLGVTPRSGLTLKADVGALFGDTGGTMTNARHYWSNKATGLVNDVPGEADLSPNLWGTWTLE